MTLNSLEDYGHSFQIKTIFLLLTKKEFLNNIYDILTENYFSNQAHKWIVRNLIDYYNKFHTIPGLDYFKNEIKKLPNEILQTEIKGQLNEIYNVHSVDLEYVEEEFPRFVKDQELKKALLESADLLGTGDYDSIRGIIDRALKAGQDRNVGHEYVKDVFSRYIENKRNPIPFPWPQFNDITQGGYGGGELILMFGNPGGGKTWAAIAMAAHAARQGRKVVFYTLELSESAIGKRLDAYLSGIPIQDLDRTDKNKLHELISKEVKGNIIIKGYPPRKASLYTVENHLAKLKSVNDFVPELIIIDYLDLFKNKKSRREKKEDIDDIYTEAKGLAMSLNVPIVSPSQINRAGAKDDILEADKIAGSYDKIMIADMSFSLARKRQDKLNNTGRWHVMKNRFGPDGMTYDSTIDTSNGNIEIGENISGEDFNVRDINGFDSKDKNYLKDQVKEFFKV